MLRHLRRQVLVLCAVVLLTGSHAFTVTHQAQRITHNNSNIHRMNLAAALNASSDDKSVASKSTTKRKRPPPKKQYDMNMAQAIALNKKLIACENTEDILSLLVSRPGALTKMAGGGQLNSVNFSTALHRMARFCSNNRAIRKKTLTDPRFALFICSLSEAMAGMDYTLSLSEYHESRDINSSKKKGKSLSFTSRECSNIAWSIAKIQLAPPASALPLDLSNELNHAIVATCLKCRSQVLEGSRERQQLWIPTLSLLSGQLLDAISYGSNKATTSFNTQESANLLWSLATAQRADKDVFEHISSSLVANLSTQTKPQEFSNSIWAFGKSRIHCKGQESLLRYTADALKDDQLFVDKWKCNELSNAAWGCATILSNKSNRSPEEDACAVSILRSVANELIKRPDDFRSQEITNSCWAMATLGFGISAETGSASNDYTFLMTDDPVGDRQLMERALHAVSKSALPRLNAFRSMELNNLAYAFARLGRTESNDLYAGIAKEFARPKRVVTGQDIGTTLWSFSLVEYFDKDAYRLIASRVNVDDAQNYSPTELANSVYALASAEVEAMYPDSFDTALVAESLRPSNWKDDPVTVCFAIAAKELTRRPHEYKSQEIKDVLWSFSKAGVRHPDLFKAVAEYLVGKASDAVPDGQIHCGRGLDDFTPQGIGNLVWSYAKQAQLAVETVNRVEGLSSLSSGRLFVFTTICLDIGESLVKRLFNCCAETDLAKFDNLAVLSAIDLSNTAWAFSVLGLRHTRFFEAMSNQVIQRLSRATNDYAGFKGQEISNICWSCATINCHFPDMLDVISSSMCRLCELPGGGYSARSIAQQQCKRQELSNMAWSCAVLNHYPPGLMDLLYAGLVGNGDERNAEYLSQVFGDGGLQKQAIMSLLYVQMAVDMEWPNNALTLPENFPDGWGSNDDVASDAGVSVLSLSTSRIQSDVSTTFDRIGFRHTEEHVIDMDELSINHGIQLSSKPSLEILSIDIADVDKKVGIEVDGPGHFISVLDTWSPQEETRGYVKLSKGKMEYQFEWDDRHLINGSTALKDRLLQGLGWRILHIPFWEWHALKGDARAKEEYCTELLKDI